MSSAQTAAAEEFYESLANRQPNIVPPVVQFGLYGDAVRKQEQQQKKSHFLRNSIMIAFMVVGIIAFWYWFWDHVYIQIVWGPRRGDVAPGTDTSQQSGIISIGGARPLNTNRPVTLWGIGRGLPTPVKIDARLYDNPDLRASRPFFSTGPDMNVIGRTTPGEGGSDSTPNLMPSPTMNGGLGSNAGIGFLPGAMSGFSPIAAGAAAVADQGSVIPNFKLDGEKKLQWDRCASYFQNFSNGTSDVEGMETCKSFFGTMWPAPMVAA